MLFNELNINKLIVKAAGEEGYETVSPIQEKAIPIISDGKDVLGVASTGTGKTAAFAMPILDKLATEASTNGPNEKVQALVLAPTRELAIQIGESFETYGKYLDLDVGVVFGGVTPKRHIKVLKRLPNILVATPGRLLDLVERGAADLSHIKILVLDEADRMFDLGMKKDVNKVISLLPNKRQNLLFSATIPNEIKKLINGVLIKPSRITIEKSEEEAKIQEEVYFVDETKKTAFLIDLLKQLEFESILIFTRTKKKAEKVSKAINISNVCRSKAIHGDKNQSERSKNLELFKNKEAKILVATDIAARGIDVDNVTLVINMNIPDVPQTYVHRIGRTGRAGLSGRAISFCSEDEKPFLREIEGLGNHMIIKH